MPVTIVCEGTVTIPENPTRLPTCDTNYIVVPYVEPTDSAAIYAQLVALNEFDPVQIASIVSFCLALFIVGFGVGMVINKLRRS